MSALPNIAGRRREIGDPRKDDLDRRAETLAFGEQSLRQRERAIAAREAALAQEEAVALEERVDATLDRGRVALFGVDRAPETVRSRSPVNVSAEQIVAAGISRRAGGEVPLPSDRTARAIILCGELRRGRLTGPSTNGCSTAVVADE